MVPKYLAGDRTDIQTIGVEPGLPSAKEQFYKLGRSGAGSCRRY
jgi:hypothetical protein